MFVVCLGCTEALQQCRKKAMLVKLLALHNPGQWVGKLFGWCGHCGLEKLTDWTEQVDGEEKIFDGICEQSMCFNVN